MTAMVNVVTKRKFRTDRDGYVTTARGPELLDTPLLNKGTAYSREERAALGLEGLLPSAVQTLDDQVARAYEQYHEQPTDLQKNVFLTMFLIQAVVFFFLPNATSFVLFGVLSAVIALCYGGGFGTMPAFAADYFGPRFAGSIYGLMLTAWGVGGAFGPILIAQVRDRTGNYRGAMYVIAVVMLIAAAIPLFVRPPAVLEDEAATMRTKTATQPS